MICRRYFVMGQVQGVCYRAGARDKALELGVDGYARNLPDGRVEVLAAGPEDALTDFALWLGSGPPQAVVEAVEREDVAEQPEKGFYIR